MGKLQTMSAANRLKHVCSSLALLIAFMLSFAPQETQAKWKNPFPFPSDAGDFRKRSEKKEASRWTLKEWLEQKEKNRMMDLWLGMYTPSPYEIILSGDYSTYESKLDNPAQTSSNFSYSGGLAFYALILGLEAQYENNWREGYTDLSTFLNLRVMGNAVQGTHLNLQYGQKKRTADPQFSLNQQFIGADLDIYIERHIGIHGNYRSYFPTTDVTLGDINQKRTEAGLFFDISFVRFFGNWFLDTTTIELAGTKSVTEKTGMIYGLKLFF